MAKQYGFESEEDFLRMQQEAIRRVREMQSRARATLEKAGMHIENGETNASSEQRQAANHRQDLSSRTFSSKNTFGSADSENSLRQDASCQRYDNVSNPSKPHNSSYQGGSRTDGFHGGSHFDAPRNGGPYANDREIDSRPKTDLPAETQSGSSAVKLPGLNLSLDSDQLLLLITIYLLIKDGGDRWLILALAYILI